MNAATSSRTLPRSRSHDAPSWPDLPLLPLVQAESRNRLARWCTRLPRHVELLEETLEVDVGAALGRYPLTVHLHSADGDLRLGCDLAALFPETSRDVLPAVASQDHADGKRASWMLAPWIDCLTQHLAQELHLTAIVHDQRWDYPHWAMQIRRLHGQGQSGTLGVTGSLLPRLAAALPVQAPCYDHLAHIPITLDWRVKAPALSHAQLQTLAPNTIILLHNQSAQLCLTGRQGTIRLSGAIEKGKFVVNETHLVSEDTLAAPDARTGMIPLDMLMASIDVVLDSIVMPLSEIAALAPGAALPLSQFETGRAVTLRCNGAAFARGEVVVIGERLGVLITHKAGVLDECTTQPR